LEATRYGNSRIQAIGSKISSSFSSFTSVQNRNINCSEVGKPKGKKKIRLKSTWEIDSYKSFEASLYILESEVSD
jgi:hypothetical protein